MTHTPPHVSPPHPYPGCTCDRYVWFEYNSHIDVMCFAYVTIVYAVIAKREIHPRH